MMSVVRCKDAAPERVVRAPLFTTGYRCRLRRMICLAPPMSFSPSPLPVAVFVHGCSRDSTPSSWCDG